jgi:hypothetical protein
VKSARNIGPKGSRRRDRRRRLVPFVVAVFLLLTVTQVGAATQGSIPLSGTVGTVCSITVNQQAGATTLTLTASQTNLLIATATENCNDHNGYFVTVMSRNAGTPAGQGKAFLGGAVSGNPDKVPYTISYAGTTLTLDATGAARGKDTTFKTTGQGVTSNVTITYTGVSNLGADTYSDTITLTIGGK